MAGISIMAPFAATIVAMASPNPQINAMDIKPPPNELAADTLSNQDYLTLEAATAVRYRWVPKTSKPAPNPVRYQGDPLGIRICSNC